MAQGSAADHGQSHLKWWIFNDVALFYCIFNMAPMISRQARQRARGSALWVDRRGHLRVPDGSTWKEAMLSIDSQSCFLMF